MRGKWISVAGLIFVAAVLLTEPSCARPQQLVAINLTPTLGFVFEGYGAQGQFTAWGTYIHPPETKDITDEVVWSLDIAYFGTLTQTGLITYTRTDGCGSGNVTATWYSNPSDPEAGSAISGSAPVSGGMNALPSCQ